MKGQGAKRGQGCEVASVMPTQSLSAEGRCREGCPEHQARSMYPHWVSAVTLWDINSRSISTASPCHCLCNRSHLNQLHSEQISSRSAAWTVWLHWRITPLCPAGCACRHCRVQVLLLRLPGQLRACTQDRGCSPSLWAWGVRAKVGVENNNQRSCLVFSADSLPECCLNCCAPGDSSQHLSPS